MPACLTAGTPCHLPPCVIARLLGLLPPGASRLPLVQFVHNPPRYLPNVLSCLGARNSPTQPRTPFPGVVARLISVHPRKTSSFPEAARGLSAHPDGDRARQDQRSTPLRTPPHRSVRRRRTSHPQTTRRIPRDTQGRQGDTSRQPRDRTPISEGRIQHRMAGSDRRRARGRHPHTPRRHLADEDRTPTLGSGK